ncbi:MAG TPA: phospho-sugar mutase [Candidatus Limnocylindrales bacterium]|nr:phospho-sugar mutase [Candidatus Limnocylindrales bacterium]
MIDEKISTNLSKALQDKKINKKAHDEIIKWLIVDEFKEFVPQLTSEINNANWDKLMDCFYRVVIFGTGGIRGIMDLGTNRINNYTIRWASQAYSQYLLKTYTDVKEKGVALAYDSRNHSEEFMKETARVLAANGIPVHTFSYYRATPELSFTVRELGCKGGIVITASHNPPQFNGYKVYDENGVQVLPDMGIEIENEFKTIKEIKKMNFDDAVKNGFIKYIGEEIDKKFAESAKAASIYNERNIKIVYSPMHGVGSQSVLPVLKELGFKDIVLVEDQMSMDGNFPNVEGQFPNPEFPIVYIKAIELAKKVSADIVLLSDPDADRLGMAIPDKVGNWTPLNGNQGAVIMTYFILDTLSKNKLLPKNPVMVKTSVTTDLFRDIAESFGVEVIGDLLVGFKFIGDRIQNLPADKNFIFAAEESVGYLSGTAYRDKGAETPAVIAAEMAAYCKNNNLAPMDLLENIYKKYGYYAERLYYKAIEGFGAFEQMNMSMEKLREKLPTEIAGRKVIKVLDRLTGEIRNGQTGKLIETREWDKGDMLSFFFTEDERTVVHARPSGTEAKMKYYTAVKGMLTEKSKDELNLEAEKIEVAMAQIFENILKSIKIDVFK